MRKIELSIDKMIQGKFKIQKLNLLLMFQVNCPGCFYYALPLFNELYTTYKDQLGFIALSTAFEDFNFNSERNTEALVKEGTLVGETKKALNEQGIFSLHFPLLTPIGMDKKMEPDQKESLTETICNTNPNYKIWSAYDQNLMKKNVLNYIDKQEEVSITFTGNQFRGTPTIALFNEEKELLGSWFGHTAKKDIINKITQFIHLNV